MGLDVVELVMDVEEEFDIKVPDGDYEFLATVGDFHGYICVKTQVKKSDVCLSSKAFLRLRRGLMSAIGIDREQVRLETPIDELVPISGRRQNWHRLQEDMRVRLPELRRPEWLSTTLQTGAIAAILVSFLTASATLTDPFGPKLVWLSLFPLSIAATVLAYWLTVPWAVCLSPGCVTIRNLTTTVLNQNYYRLLSRENLPVEPSDEVYRRLVNMVSEHLGVPLEDIHPESRFIEDLGCG
ncbi:Acyl carrier protein [Symmachiella dynata]|uniref:Acyl carrier protein n=1 Tax=Symmachiella dynata TaxID=2527995 RepID=A0A517ZX89_9PLAN|nr:hypothetical protein [Symmachiella dynata]QDU47097.1 Acyl carrier protein [Symmachiella dynata]